MLLLCLLLYPRSNFLVHKILILTKTFSKQPLCNSKHDSDCEKAGFCDVSPIVSPVLIPRSSNASEPDIRVSKGFGTKAYNSVRVSVITQGAPSFDTSNFDYSGQFKYKWTHNYITSTMMTVPKPGIPTTIKVGTTEVTIDIPSQGSGVAGLLFGDPCVRDASFTSLVGCTFAKKFQTSTRNPEMLNAVRTHD